MSEKPNERTADRQSYHGPVWLKPEEGVSLVGDIRNVSRGGMFVNVVPTPPIGGELLCELPGYRAVRGRVVWVSSPAELADHGVGIEFIDLSEKPTPILAMPTTTYAGIELQGPLDFLEEGAEIHVAATNGHRQLRARVADVVMDHSGGATHLALSLVISPPITPSPVRDADDDWFPDITVEPHRVATPIAVAAEVVAADVVTTEICTPVVIAPKPAVLEAIEPELAEVDEPAKDNDLLASLTHRDSQLDDTLAVQPGTDDTERTHAVAPLPRPAPQRRVVIPLAVVTGLIFAGLAILRVGFPASEPVAPLPVAPLPAQVAAAPEPAPVSSMNAAEASPSADVEPAPAAHVEPAVTAHVPPPRMAPASIDPATWKPEVTLSKGEPSVLVPLKGSTKGMSSFVLDQPYGIAVDLPNAQLAVTAKSYLLHHAQLTSLWVRKLDKGLQIRMHVVKGVKLEAVVEDGALRIRKR